MVVACGLMALVAARKPIFNGIKSVFTSDAEDEAARPDFPLSITISGDEHFRYDIVPVEVAYVDSKGTPITDAMPEVVVRDPAGDLVETVGRSEGVALRFDSTAGVWRGAWPVPFGAQAGVDKPYTVEVEASFKPGEWAWETPEAQRKREKADKRKPRPVGEPEPAGEATCVATAELIVSRRGPMDLPPGACVVTWENAYPMGDRLIKPDGTQGDWRTMFDWAEFMGADALWYRGAVTEAYGPSGALTHDNPWVQSNLDVIPKLGEEAHRRGLKFGVWAAAMETYPNKPSQHRKAKQYKPDYRFTENYSRSRQEPEEEAAISLLDNKRREHLTKFMADMQALESVDHVGFDYIRSGADWGGYELAEEFGDTMPVVGRPDNWSQLSRTQKMGWVCNSIEGTNSRGVANWAANIDLYHQWHWFRAHKLSQYLRRAITDAQLEKPLWCFTLSWWHGEQHGQDPLMMADAGVALNAVMLYQCETPGHYESTVDQWRNGNSIEAPGIPSGHTNILGGDQVGMSMHRGISGVVEPEELYRRITKAASEDKGLTQGGPLYGAFVHDVNRICSPALAGNRGPFPPREWALAGAAAFSAVRANWQVQPVKCSLVVPKNSAVGTTFTSTLNIRNTCGKPVEGITIQVMDTPGINPVTTRKAIGVLGPNETIKVPIEAQVTGWDANRKSRYMLAVKVAWNDADYGETVRRDLPWFYTVMHYLNAA